MDPAQHCIILPRYFYLFDTMHVLLFTSQVLDVMMFYLTKILSDYAKADTQSMVTQILYRVGNADFLTFSLWQQLQVIAGECTVVMS